MYFKATLTRIDFDIDKMMEHYRSEHQFVVNFAFYDEMLSTATDISPTDESIVPANMTKVSRKSQELSIILHVQD